MTSTLKPKSTARSRQRPLSLFSLDLMRSARLIAAIVVALIVGLALGWYAGYTRPVAKANRDARRYLGLMEYDEQMTAALALDTICRLEQEHSQQAKELLAQQLATYYVIYGPPDNPKKRISDDRMKMLRRIEEAARDYPFVQAAIEKSKQSVAK
jgi:hypothetical protein